MKCKHYYNGRCTNGECYYGADLCPLDECQETCVNFEAVKKKVPAEKKQISDTELLQECEKHGIDIDDLINEFEKLVEVCFVNQIGDELTLEEVKKTHYYTIFLERALTLKILKEYKKEHNAVKQWQETMRERVRGD